MILQRFSQPMHLRETRPDPSRGTVLYLHGLGESCLAFEGLLGDGRTQPFRQLAPDLLGYGKSPWPRSPLGLEELADSVGQWLDDRVRREELGRVVVVGHSMGGVLGLLLCERFSHLVQGLINIEGNVSAMDCAFSGQIAAFTLEGFEREGYGKLLQEVYREGLENPPLQTYFASMRICHPSTLHRCAKELLEISEQEVLAGRLAALKIPQIYLLGDPRGTGAHSRALLDAASIPWKAIDDAGHWLFLDQPEEFSRVFAEQLERMSS